jgi:hypothetical protein
VFGPLWPDSLPEGWPLDKPARTDPPDITIIWDPKVVSAADYAYLIKALGNVVRAEGGAGLERIRSNGYGAPVEGGVTV